MAIKLKCTKKEFFNFLVSKTELKSKYEKRFINAGDRIFYLEFKK